MTGIENALQDAFAERYALQHELGRGGTSIVYLARDLQTGRTVAIKVLRQELIQSIGADRFLKEIRLTQRLNHPNVVAVLDAGKNGDVVYFVLPLMEGGTLRQKLEREGQLPLADAIAIAKAVAAGLSHAHQHGLVHRDVKPENVLLTADGVCISDFGIARVIERVSGDTTSSGLIRGTPPYMSPEQATGSDVDARSDIYSLGCVLYEMVAGVQPFVGPTPQSVIAQRLVGGPPELERYRPALPGSLGAVIKKAMAPWPADRFQSADELTRALDDASRRLSDPPTTVRAATRRRVYVGMAAAAALLTAGLLWRYERRPEVPPKLIVLPFTHVGPAADDFIAEGLGEDVTSRVAGISGLTVIARSTAIHYSPRVRPRDLARDLRVDYALTATVRSERAPDGTLRIRVTPYLTRADREEEVWSQSFDLNITGREIFALQAQIAERIADALHVSLRLPERAELAVRSTTNAGAYEWYLRGNAYLRRRYEETPARLAIESFTRAVAADSLFAPAWARLAEAQILYFYNHDRQPDRLAAAHASADRAFAIDSSLTEARLARGYYYWWGNLDAERALEELRVVRERQPNNSEVLWIIGQIQRRHGQWADALVSLRRAFERDPGAQLYAVDLASTLTFMRRYEEAEKFANSALQLAPHWIPAVVTKSVIRYLWRGDRTQARTVLESERGQIDFTELLKYIAHRYPNYVSVIGGELDDSLRAATTGRGNWDPAELYLARGYSFSAKRDLAGARANYDSARVLLETRVRAAPGEADFHALLGVAYAGLARRADALRECEAAAKLLPLSRDAARGTVLRVMQLGVEIQVGDTASAMSHLDLLLRNPSSISKAVARTDPWFGSLRANPRFAQLVAGPEVSY